MKHLLYGMIFILVSGSAQAQSDPDAGPQGSEPPMTLNRLAQIILALDPDAVVQGAMFEFTIRDVPVLVVTDPRADRMRAMVPIRAAEGLDAAELMRLMQANFDSALDARYAVAQGRLWGVFIHPLSPLERDQFLSGVAQTVNVAQSYGQTYSGGAQVFGGGDSNGIYEQLLEDLRERGEEL
ncbi:MAG: hypothetical protein AAF636_03925 [Pseudomonadota bacterium]